MKNINSVLNELGVDLKPWTGSKIHSFSPINGTKLASLAADDSAQVAGKVASAHAAYLQWREVPAPRRGELVRLFGDELREHKASLGQLVTLEAGKILQEGLGEVQEMIDICDFAVGLSRQLYGLTIASERPGHRMMEQWHPVGVIGVISAFNFPVAVWAWNAALAFVWQQRDLETVRKNTADSDCGAYPVHEGCGAFWLGRPCRSGRINYRQQRCRDCHGR